MKLQATDLAVARGGLILLECLNFQVHSGEALVLRGPNGIGKTTLLRCLAGLTDPESGQVLGGEDPAYSAHLDAVKATLSVAENLGFWGKVFGVTSIAQALDAWNLTDLRNRPAGLLSAGQKRRLGLARLMMAGRKLWIMDEPTVSLDADSLVLFRQVLSKHLNAGGAVILSTHVDLGLDATNLDLSLFKAKSQNHTAFDEAFL